MLEYAVMEVVAVLMMEYLLEMVEIHVETPEA